MAHIAAGDPRGVNEGTRTLDRLDHNQELYRLSYVHREVAGRAGRWTIAQLVRTSRALACRATHAAHRPAWGATVPGMGRVRRSAGGWTWDGVVPREYEGGAERHILVGADDGARQVELRYFRIPAGGASVRERHPHEHAVMVLHGRAEAQIGEEVHAVGPGDVVFVGSNEMHQFRACPDEPLGFLCTALVARGRA